MSTSAGAQVLQYFTFATMVMSVPARASEPLPNNSTKTMTGVKNPSALLFFLAECV